MEYKRKYLNNKFILYYLYIYVYYKKNQSVIKVAQDRKT